MSRTHHIIMLNCLIGLAAALPHTHAQDATAPRLAQLYVTSRPEGAMITLNGERRERTPATLSGLTPGVHLLTLSLSNHREARQTIELQAGQKAAADLVMEPLRGLLLLHSEPMGAEVTLDGAFRGTTPLLLTDIAVGGYRAMFSLSGYQPREIDLNIEDRIPRKISVDLVSDSATLDIRSAPPGATVLLNGLERGRTPARIDRVPGGENRLVLSHRGYRDFASILKLTAGSTETIMARLEPLPGGLTVNTLPSGARVYINDQFRGEAPLSISELEPGVYRLRAEMEGYADASQSITLGRAETRSEELRLELNSGSLQVVTFPPGVTVLVDGRERGLTPDPSNPMDRMSDPLIVDGVQLGERKVSLVKRGFHPKQAIVEVRRGEVSPLQGTLSKQYIPDTEIKTASEVFTGVFIEEDSEGNVRLEIRPGITKLIQRRDIIERRRISDTQP